MTDAEFKAFKDTLLVLAEHFEANISETQYQTYFEALRELDFSGFTVAVKIAIQEWRIVRTLPPVALLLEYARGGSRDDCAARAWEVLVTVFRRAGVYDSVLFEDGGIGYAVLLLWGSWRMFVNEYETLSPEMLSSKRKQFTAAWKAQSQRGPCYLPGLLELSNRQNASVWSRPVSETFHSLVTVVSANGDIRKVRAQFNRRGALDTPVSQLLSAPRLALPKGDDE